MTGQFQSNDKFRYLYKLELIVITVLKQVDVSTVSISLKKYVY